MEKKYQVFISSTYEDLKEERKKVQDTILGMYQFPIGMEMFSAADEEQWKIIQETIDSSDFYVLIIGHRYGSIISEGEYAGISYTEKEFLYALKKEIPVLAFLISDKVPVLPDKMEQDIQKKSKLQTFIDKVKSGRTVQWWTSTEDLANKVMNSLNKQITKGKRPGWIRADKIDFEATQNEIVEMSKKIRLLEEENSILKKQIIVRKPNFLFNINGNTNLMGTYKKISVNDFEAELIPISKEDAEGYNISEEEINEYNKSLPTKDELENYLEKCRMYRCIKENGIPIKFKWTNIGNQKANDINVHITFSDGLLIMKKGEVDELKMPLKPDTLENPVERKIKKRMGLDNIESLQKIFSPNIFDMGLDKIKLPIDDFSYNIYHSENIKANCLNIWSKGLMHTEEDESDEYILVPIAKGKYQISISVICEEFPEEFEQKLTVIIE